MKKKHYISKMKKNNNIYYVYLHIKETTGEPFYVGKGKGGRMMSKHRRNNHWHNVVNKHKYDVIVLEDGLSEEKSFQLEKYWIDRIGRKDLNKGPLVNMTDGGDGSSGSKHSEETKKKISESKKGKNSGKNHHFYGKKHSEETKKKIGNKNRGKKHSEETIKKKIESRKGKKHSEESKRKMSESKLGVKNPMYGKKGNGGKLILNTITGIFYDSITEASQSIGITRGCLRNNLNGITKKNKTNLIKV